MKALRPFIPNRNSNPPNAAQAEIDPAATLFIAVMDAAVVTTTFTAVGFAPTVAEALWHSARLGSPEHVIVTSPLKPPTGVRANAYVALAPAATVCEGGDSATSKSVTDSFRTEDVLALKLPSPE
jgi:hypothetical protein